MTGWSRKGFSWKSEVAERKYKRMLSEAELYRIKNVTDVTIVVTEDSPLYEHIQNDDIEAFGANLLDSEVYRKLSWRGGNILHMCLELKALKQAYSFAVNAPELLDEKNSDGNTPLLVAFKSLLSLNIYANTTVGTEVFQDLIKLLAPNKKVCDIADNRGRTALIIGAVTNTNMLSVYEEQDAMELNILDGALNWLLSSGADINAKDIGGTTALLASLSRNIEKLARRLIIMGANISSKELFLATSGFSEAGCTSLLETMLERSPILINAELKGDTLLSQSVARGLCSTVKMLIERGASLHVKLYPKPKNHLLMSSLQLKNSEICKMLIGAGADIFSDDNDLEVLKLVIDSRNCEIMALVTKSLSNINYEISSNAPLVLAIDSKFPRSLKFALQLVKGWEPTSIALNSLNSRPRSIAKLPGELETTINGLTSSKKCKMGPIAYLMSKLDGENIEPIGKMLKQLVNAGYFDPKEDALSPLTSLLLRYRPFCEEEERNKFAKLFDIMLETLKVDLDQRHLQVDLEGVEILRKNGFPVPDALLVAFVTLNIRAVLQLMQFWRGPPAALAIAAIHKYNRANRVFLEMVKTLLPYGFPQHNPLFKIVQEQMAWHPDSEMAEEFRQYAATPCRLEHLALYKVRESCNVKGSELPQTLASMVPEVLWPTMLFQFQNKQLDVFEKKIHQDLMTRCRAAGITNFGRQKKQQSIVADKSQRQLY